MVSSKRFVYTKSKFSSEFSPFKLVKKKNFLSISELLSEIVIFCLKREVCSEFSQKCFKTTEKHSLAVCGSHLGETQFLLIFVPFYWFDQKHLFTPNPNIPLDFNLLKRVKKSKYSEYF